MDEHIVIMRSAPTRTYEKANVMDWLQHDDSSWATCVFVRSTYLLRIKQGF